MVQINPPFQTHRFPMKLWRLQNTQSPGLCVFCVRRSGGKPGCPPQLFEAPKYTAMYFVASKRSSLACHRNGRAGHSSRRKYDHGYGQMTLWYAVYLLLARTVYRHGVYPFVVCHNPRMRPQVNGLIQVGARQLRAQSRRTPRELRCTLTCS